MTGDYIIGIACAFALLCLWFSARRQAVREREESGERHRQHLEWLRDYQRRKETQRDGNRVAAERMGR